MLVGHDFWPLAQEEYPGAVGYVRLRMPGFATDGNTALVRFVFGPTAHGATATYMLVRTEHGWRIVAQGEALYA